MTEMMPEQKLLDIIKSAQRKLKIKKELRIFTKINIALAVLIIVILAVFLKDFLTFDYNVPSLDVDLAAEDQIAPPAADFVKDEAEDLRAMPKEDSSINGGVLIKDLSLLGIVEGNKNQAIVEDKKANRTFFLYKGDSFGEFKVYDIKDSRVILEYKGNKIELNI